MCIRDSINREREYSRRGANYSSQVLKAKNNVVSTTEPFNQWIMNSHPQIVGDSTLNVAKGTNGIAIAIYESNKASKPPRFGGWSEYNPLWWLETHGGLTDPNPPEWLRQISPLVLLAHAAKGLSCLLYTSRCV